MASISGDRAPPTAPAVYTMLEPGVDREENIQVMKDFLREFPKSIPADRNPKSTIMDLSVREVLRRTVGTAIDIIDDVSHVLSERRQMSNAQLRKSLFGVFMQPERRMYVGLWLVFLSFVLYFIDSAA